MKLKQRTLLLLSALLLVIPIIPNVVYAMNTGFLTAELSEEDQNTFLTNIAVSQLTSEPKKKGILCFDVNKNGMIAIGQEGTHSKEVCIYTSEGSYMYGYSFNCSQSFYVEWDENNINIYFVRSDVIISLDPYANLLDIRKVQDTIDNNLYSLKYLNSPKRVMGNITFEVRNSMALSSYSQLVTIDSNGKETIVYDVSSTQLTKSIVILGITIVLISIAVISIGKEFKLKHNR